MEHPGKFIDNAALRDAIESTSGLGTPATRADIIEKLFSSFYIERRGKEIVPTSKGIQLVGLVPQDLKSPDLTARWEMQLSMISKGRANPDMFINDMKGYASKLVSNVIASSVSYRHDNMTREKCPDCGNYLLDVNSKKGKMLVCSNCECRYRKGISQVSNARCPECKKKMEIRGEGENKIFFCSCGYREKLADFNKRKSEEVNKKEVSSFLRQQETPANINSALAEALSKWKK
jgi:DNA topoisomerase-3